MPFPSLTLILFCSLIFRPWSLQGILVKSEAKRYGLSTKLDSPIDSEDKDLVLQFEVRLQEGLNCGGAYLKFLTSTEGFEPETLSEKSGYSVMFGPDKCGATNQVHLILRHQNPVSGEWEEKHLKTPAAPKIDSDAHLYTAILRKDKSFVILIDSVEVKSGTITDEMVAFVDGKKKDYGFQVPEEIDDPEDSKPSDWVDEAKIKDPDAEKPDDWDEDAPKTIPDPDAEKPEDWLDDEPDYVPDPDADMPEDWDEEEDGEWEAPEVPNPKCAAASGCGEWVRPTIDNPDYKGKWIHPMIDNPDYIGVWKPRQIANPAYFSEETHPEAFKTLVAPIGGVAVEIWTMQSGIHFDNIYIGNDIDAAAEWARLSFGEEQKKEAAAKKAAAAAKRAAERAKQWEEGGFGAKVSVIIGATVDIIADNLIAFVVTTSVLFVSLAYYCCCSGEDLEEFEDIPEEEAAAETEAEPEADEPAVVKAADVAGTDEAEADAAAAPAKKTDSKGESKSEAQGKAKDVAKADNKDSATPSASQEAEPAGDASPKKSKKKKKKKKKQKAEVEEDA